MIIYYLITKINGIFNLFAVRDYHYTEFSTLSRYPKKLKGKIIGRGYILSLYYIICMTSIVWYKQIIAHKSSSVILYLYFLVIHLWILLKLISFPILQKIDNVSNTNCSGTLGAPIFIAAQKLGPILYSIIMTPPLL